MFQGDLHQRLLTYTSDAVSAFMTDLERLGRADDVAVMMFSEFGRRVPENTSLGTDHGAANLMFTAGKKIKGGHYGQIPSLTKLDDGDNLVYTDRFPSRLREHDFRLARPQRHCRDPERQLRDIRHVWIRHGLNGFNGLSRDRRPR